MGRRLACLCAALAVTTSCGTTFMRIVPAHPEDALSVGGIPPISSASAVHRGTWTVTAALTESLTRVPELGGAFDLTGGGEVHLPADFSVSVESGLDGLLFPNHVYTASLTGRWHSRLTPSGWLATSLQLTHMSGKIGSYIYDYDLLESRTEPPMVGIYDFYVRQRLSGLGLCPAVTVTFTDNHRVEVSATAGAQLAWMRIRPAHYGTGHFDGDEEYVTYPYVDSSTRLRHTFGSPYVRALLGGSLRFGGSVRGVVTIELALPTSVGRTDWVIPGGLRRAALTGSYGLEIDL